MGILIVHGCGNLGLTDANDLSAQAISVLNQLENNNMSCSCEQMQREDMFKQIKCLNFAIIELGLYLDTHPNDTRAICLHNKYCKECKELEDSYQKVFGPLSIKYPCNKWRWLESPWPWEGGDF